MHQGRRRYRGTEVAVKIVDLLRLSRKQERQQRNEMSILQVATCLAPRQSQLPPRAPCPALLAPCSLTGSLYYIEALVRLIALYFHLGIHV